MRDYALFYLGVAYGIASASSVWMIAGWYHRGR